MVNYLIKINHECTWQEIEARVTYDLEDMLGQVLVKHSLLNENKNTSVWLAEIADYNKFKNIMNSPEEKALDKEMGIKYQVYSLQALKI